VRLLLQSNRDGKDRLQQAVATIRGDTNLTSPPASTYAFAPVPATAEVPTPLHPSRPRVHALLSFALKFCLLHPFCGAANTTALVEIAKEGFSDGIGPPYRSFSHSSTSLISEFQQSSLRRSSSITRCRTVAKGTGGALASSTGNFGSGVQPNTRKTSSLVVAARSRRTGESFTKVGTSTGRRACTYGWANRIGARPPKRQTSRIGNHGRWRMKSSGKNDTTRSVRMCGV